MHASLLLFAALVPWWTMAEDNLDLAFECIKEYKKVVYKITDEKSHCLRLQLAVNCLSKHPEQSTRLLDDGRYMFTQESIFVQKIGICPHIDYHDLKKIVDKTDVAKKYKYLHVNGRDYDQKELDCAREVHISCMKKYSKLLRDGKLCNDLEAMIDCYDDEAKRDGCQAVILNHFKNVLKVVGKSIVKSFRRSMGPLCSKTEL